MDERYILLLAREFKKLKEDVKSLLSIPMGKNGEKGEKGEQGLPGKDGKDGINGLNGVDGKDGKDGIDGIDGKDGISVVDAKVDFDGRLVLILSNGTELDAGPVTPEQAADIYTTLKQGALSLNELLPSQTGNSGKYLTTDGTNASWGTVTTSSGTVTSVSVVSANGFSGTVATPTSTPAITLSTSITGILYGNGTGVSATTINAPLTNSSGTLSISQATTSTNGYLSSTDWNTFNGKQAALVSGTNIKTIGGATVLGSGDVGTIGIAYGGTGQTTYTNGQLLIGNTTGNTLTKATLTQGNGVAITNGAGSITIAGALAQSTSAFTTGSAQTYTAPANTQWVKVTVVGPGGNGGGAASARATGGGGGGVAIKWLSMTAGQTLTYTVGTASGTASTVSSGTLVITTITANSGTNGTSTAYALSQTAGGAGGTATNGDVNITGGQGGYSYGSSTTVSTNFSGKGGDCPGFGSGGPALSMVATAGVQGNGYGAGGGGAHGSATTAAGRGGIIIFEAY